MDNSQQLYGYWRDQHSFFDDLVTMLMTLSSYMFTLHCTISSNNPREFSERTLQEWISYIRPLKDFEFPFTLEEVSKRSFLVFYPAAIIHHIALNGWPDVVEYRSLGGNDTPSNFSVSSNENRHILSRIVGASFVNYYSSQEDNIKSKYGEAIEIWPQQINFARLVRNGFAHGGLFHILNQKAANIVWRIWNIGPQQNGKSVLFGTDGLGIGDLIRLMEDVDTSLR
jgi:hypothetical protein